MTLLKIHSETPYASRAGEFYRRQRDNLIRKHICQHPGCEAKFYIKSQLTAHIRQHTGECPFQCDKCDYAAKQKILLDKHRLREHDIALPSTRITRHKERISLPAWCACHRETKYTGKIPTHKQGRLAQRVDLYLTSNDILQLLEDTTITKKEFYADKSAGYISDYWSIYALQYPTRTFPIGNSQRNTEKIANFMNQIHNLHILYPQPNAFAQELASLQSDNKKSETLISQSMMLYSNVYNLQSTPHVIQKQ